MIIIFLLIVKPNNHKLKNECRERNDFN